VGLWHENSKKGKAGEKNMKEKKFASKEFTNFYKYD
jgi:hypothetical protein